MTRLRIRYHRHFCRPSSRHDRYGFSGAWQDNADGTSAIRFDYRWELADNISGRSSANTTIASNDPTYSIQNADNERFIGCVVTATDSGFPDEASTTLATPWVQIGNLAPSIGEGERITVTMSEDGAPTPFTLTLNGQDDSDGLLQWSVAEGADFRRGFRYQF